MSLISHVIVAYVLPAEMKQTSPVSLFTRATLVSLSCTISYLVQKPNMMSATKTETAIKKIFIVTFERN